MNVFLDFEHNPLQFNHPAAVITCYEPSALSRAFAEIERALEKGLYSAGFLSYEAGYSFEESLRKKDRYEFPLLMMGIYERPVARRLRPEKPDNFSVADFCLNVSKNIYDSHIDIIRGHIARGDVYQITYCVKFHFKFRGDPLALYVKLLRRQAVPYPAYIQAGNFTIISLSPERFFKKVSSRVLTEPMKGTWPRGSDLFSDLAGRFRFWRDEKNRAENLMICDLLRNDLGRIGKNVRAPKLFTVAQYKTLYQMTSTVTGKILPDIPLEKIFGALFPSGSVTGAPKIRAMEIIRSLENEERRIYTGAIGYITPDRSMYFNIPIRTVLVSGESAEMGVGGGIVWDSTAQGEWDEGLLKARFLTELSSSERKWREK